MTADEEGLHLYTYEQRKKAVELYIKYGFALKCADGKEYRKKLYTYEEILEIIGKYGLPQDWNDDGKYGPERYIEAHVWSDTPIAKYMAAYEEAM